MYRETFAYSKKGNRYSYALTTFTSILIQGSASEQKTEYMYVVYENYIKIKNFFLFYLHSFLIKGNRGEVLIEFEYLLHHIIKASNY